VKNIMQQVHCSGESMRKVFVVGIVTASLASLAAVTLLSPLGSQAQSQKPLSNAAMVQAGKDVVAQKCMQCHSVIEGQAMLGPSLYRETKKSHGNAAEIRVILKNGRGKMPSFKDRLTPEETNNLLAYLRTL
jgi:mono/diheme cytochrome c family protein